MLVRWKDMRRSVAKTLLRAFVGPSKIANRTTVLFSDIRGQAMKSLCHWLLAATLALAAPALLAADANVSGVKYPETIDLANQKLQLNGAGVRYKTIIKVYIAGLYLPKKADTTDAVLAMPGAKRMSITMLRDIDAGELGKLFTRGVEDNMDKTAFAKLVP